MSREFRRFYDLVLTEGLLDASSEVATRFRLITDNFLRLSGAAAGETGYISPEDERTTVADAFNGPAEVNSGSSAGAQSPRKSIPEPAEPPQQTSSPGRELVPVSMGSYEVVAQATPDNASFPLYTALDGVPSMAGFASISSPYTTLPISNSLSYHEISFGHRLQRRTTERGLFLASMPNPPPDRYAAVFGFSLLFESRESIARRLSHQLSNMVMPFQDQSNPHKGPTEEQMEQRIRLTFGYEKNFLNAEEIEMYLQQRGIVIPQQVEFVDAEVDLNDFADAPTEPNGGGSFSSHSSGHENLTPVSMPLTVQGNPNSHVLQHLQMQASGAVPFMGQPGMEGMWGSAWPKPKLTISVGVLVEGKSFSSVAR